MTKEISKNYEPQEVEDKIYQAWEKSDYFNPDNIEGEPYSIMMPPPNVTGVLHLGHSLENSLMDIMARYQRMQGKKVLLVPGTDHAAVATQAKVEKILMEKGIKNPREELGREKLLEEIKKYAENSKSTILKQIRRMGTSCDWSRLSYTFDDKRSAAVNEVFVKMYNDGLIYRGHRVVNWSVKGQSTLSDDEIEYKERKTKLYTFKYSQDFPISIATTRPETKLGDTAVAVNPNDERYKKYIGQTFIVEVGAIEPLKIKIIADENVDTNFGTGALGVTPSHSAIDFEMYEKQKAKNDPIEIIQVIGIDGKMTTQAGKNYVGLTVKEAREKFIEYLRENELLEKEEEIVHNVGHSDRFGDIVESLPMTQWFVDVNKKIPGKEKSLKELMHDAVAIGHNKNPEQKIKITPERFEKTYFNWIENLRDWCISRQIWWGHQIPVWYCKKCSNIEFFARSHKNDEELKIKSDLEHYSEWYKRLPINTPFIVSENTPKCCPVCNSDDLYQDPDTLDTWFSSGLWTFSTLGWPEDTTDLNTFHPSNWMQMGYEILFFWMARMILMTTYTLDTIPFKDVYIHGILRDEKGKKFSKSSGNNLDPIEIIDKYGCDALRLSLILSVSPGNDSRFYEEKVESSRNFVTKLWNIARYIISNQKGETVEKINNENLTLADKWIHSKLQSITGEITNDIKNFRFSQAAEKLLNFTWNDFAGWYVEISKFEDNKKEKQWILNDVLENILKLWHPFIPFVTEAIWTELNKKNLLMIESWPKAEQTDLRGRIVGTDEMNFDMIREVIVSIRNARVENNIDPSKKINLIIDIKKQEDYFGTKLSEIIPSQEIIIKSLRTGVEKMSYGGKIENAIQITVAGINLYIPLEGLIDIEKEKAKTEKDIEDIKKYLSRLNAQLENKQFLSKAPENEILKRKTSKRHNEAKLEQLKKYLSELK